MIEKAALSLARYFFSKGEYSFQDIPIYKYGFELLISTLINSLIILFISFSTHIYFNALFFCLGFIPLRLTAGGYHAKSHFSCITTFCIILLVFRYLLYSLNFGSSTQYLIITAMISTILIFLLSPIESNNKPLTIKHKQLQKKKSRIISCIYLIILLIFLILDNYNLPFINIYSINFFFSGALSASFSLIPAMILTSNNLK